MFDIYTTAIYDRNICIYIYDRNICFIYPPQSLFLVHTTTICVWYIHHRNPCIVYIRPQSLFRLSTTTIFVSLYTRLQSVFHIHDQNLFCMYRNATFDSGIHDHNLCFLYTKPKSVFGIYTIPIFVSLYARPKSVLVYARPQCLFPIYTTANFVSGKHAHNICFLYTTTICVWYTRPQSLFRLYTTTIFGSFTHARNLCFVYTRPQSVFGIYTNKIYYICLAIDNCQRSAFNFSLSVNFTPALCHPKPLIPTISLATFDQHSRSITTVFCFWFAVITACFEMSHGHQIFLFGVFLKKNIAWDILL